MTIGMNLPLEHADTRRSHIFGAMTAFPVALFSLIPFVENPSARDILMVGGVFAALSSIAYGIIRLSQIKMQDGLSNRGIFKAFSEAFFLTMGASSILNVLAIFIQNAVYNSGGTKGIYIFGSIATLALMLGALLSCSNKFNFLAPRAVSEREMALLQRNGVPLVVAVEPTLLQPALGILTNAGFYQPPVVPGVSQLPQPWQQQAAPVVAL